MAAVFAGPGGVEQQLTFFEAEQAFEELEAEFTAEVLIDEQWRVEEWAPESAVVRFWEPVWEADPAVGRVLTWRTEGWKG